MWTGGANYTAAPEYMGFDCESAGSLAEAFVLDDEIGLVAYAEKGLRIRAKGAVTLGSHGSISLEGVTETKLTHPKAKEEQAWIAMDCGRMRLGGSFIVHSGMAAGNDMGRSTETADCSDSVMRESFSMIPMAAKPEILQGLGAEGRIYSSMAAAASFGTESETGTVTQLQESVDSTEEAEKKAYIYVGGGHVCEGEVRGGKTYITYNYNGFLRSFFDGVDDSEYSIEPTTNETTGEYRAYKDELYNLSVEELAEKTGYSDVLSSWEYTDEYRYVVCNPVAKYGPYQLVRKGKEIKIKLYTRINAFKKEDSDDPEVKKVKPYENEKQGWFASKDEDYRNYTFYDFIMAGIQRWEGVYENHYEIVKEHWRSLSGRKILYDYFGLDGAVELKIEVCTPTEQHPVGNRVYIFDNREEALKKTVYSEFDDDKIEIEKNFNWSMVRGIKPGFIWSILNIGTVLLFTRLFEEEKKLDYSYKSDQFLDMIAHEFGHVWGLHDAYKKSDSPGWTGAKKTEEVNKDNIMRSEKEVQSNDIEMILQAWMENESQFYFAWSTYNKSIAIDYV